MDTAIISRRSRNLGYGWTNIPEEVATPRGDTFSRIRAVLHPVVSGGIRTLHAERYWCRKINNGGTWYNEAIFVAGRKIVAFRPVLENAQWAPDEAWSNNPITLISDVLAELEHAGRVEVQFESISEGEQD